MLDSGEKNCYYYYEPIADRLPQYEHKKTEGMYMKRRNILSVILVIIMLLSSVLVGCRADDGKDKGSETKEPSTSTDSKQTGESVTLKPGKYVREKEAYFSCLNLSEGGTGTLTPSPPSMDYYFSCFNTKVEGNYLLCGRHMRFEIVDSKTLKYVPNGEIYITGKETSDSLDTSDIPGNQYIPYGTLFILEEK